MRAGSRHLGTFANSSRSPAAIRLMPGPVAGCPVATSPVLSTKRLSGTRTDRREEAGPCRTPVFLRDQQNEGGIINSSWLYVTLPGSPWDLE